MANENLLGNYTLQPLNFQPAMNGDGSPNLNLSSTVGNQPFSVPFGNTTLTGVAAPTATGTPSLTPAEGGVLMAGDKPATFEQIKSYYGWNEGEPSTTKAIKLGNILETAKANGLNIETGEVNAWLDTAGKIASVRTQDANATYAEKAAEQLDWSITRDKFQLGMQVAGMGLALYDKILQNLYQNHRIDMEERMMTLAETKETNKYDLQTTLMEKESTLKDSAMKYDYKTAKLNAGTEKYKAKLAANVKTAKIKQDSIRDLFFRNQYPYGNNAYA